MYQQQVFDAALTRLNFRFPGNSNNRKLASYVTAQCAFETANFSSNAFHKDNNVCGYKYIGQANATKGIQSSEKDNYAHYVNLSASVTELVDWLYRRGDFEKVADIETYCQRLKAHSFFTSSLENYIQGCKHYFQSYDSYFVSSSLPVSSFYLPVAILLFVVLIFRNA